MKKQPEELGTIPYEEPEFKRESRTKEDEEAITLGEWK